MEHFFEVLMPIAVIGSFAVIIKIMLDARTRNKLIDKGLVDEKVKYLFSRYHGPEQRKLSNLKWGMVLVGIGLAALLAYWFPRTVNEEGAIGLMFVFAGLGFLIAYFVGPKEDQRDQRGGSNQV